MSASALGVGKETGRVGHNFAHIILQSVAAPEKKKKTWPFHLLLLLGNVVLYYRRWEGFYSLFFPYFSFLLFRCVRRGRTIISWIEKRYSEHVLIDLRSSRWRFGPCLKENFDIRPNLSFVFPFFLFSLHYAITKEGKFRCRVDPSQLIHVTMPPAHVADWPR